MDLASLAHLHLLLNHFPTVGAIVGLGLLLVSLVRRNPELQRASFEVFFVLALLTMPAYLSGLAAQEALEGRDGVSVAMIRSHHDAAFFSFVPMQITGVVAWFGLWQFRRIAHPPRWSGPVVLLLAAVTLTAMTRTASAGGEIRHPEIRASQEADSGISEPTAGTSTTERFAAFINNTPWVWTACEALHFVGLCLLFGVLLPANLRMLGVMKDAPYAALHRLLPWAMLGFAVNLLTGMMFFIALPEQYATNSSFHVKIAMLIVAGANFLYITVADDAWALAPGKSAGLRDKTVAVSAIGVWLGVMYFGRMLPFLGTAF
jgi:hypothetical protein